MAEIETIVVVGCGSIGLPFAVALARAGCAIEAYDIDTARLAGLAAGLDRPREAELATALAEVLASRRLGFVDRIEPSIACRAFVLAVPTPWHVDSGFDGSYLSAALEAVATVMRDGDALLVRSTTPVGMTRQLASRLAGKGLKVDVASIPDRTLEGTGFGEEFRVPHLVGGVTPTATERAVALLKRLGATVAVNDAESAEAAKLFSNAARHVLFSLSNEMALVCEDLGLDIHHVLQAAGEGYDRFRAPRPGPIGGPCLAKDIGILAGLVEPATARIFEAARSVNAQVIERAVRAIGAHLAGASRSPKVAVLGVAFKGRPAVDDARGSVAVEIASRLRAAHPSLTLSAWDPIMTREQVAALCLAPAADAVDAASEADVVIFANDHPALAAVDRAAIGRACRTPALVYNLTGSAFSPGRGFGVGVIVKTLGVATKPQQLAQPAQSNPE